MTPQMIRLCELYAMYQDRKRAADSGDTSAALMLSCWRELVIDAALEVYGPSGEQFISAAQELT